MRILAIGLFFCTFNTIAQEDAIEGYVTNFSYEDRKEMKVSSEEILQLLLSKEAVLVDIRFKEEQASWNMDFALQMPLHSLPKRHIELSKNQLIVTACRHKDRAIIAMMYLKSKGYRVAYLKDGLLGLAEYLRGDKAKEFIQQMKTE